jgi:hypothetical protein
MFVQHVSTTHTVNGNPRRLYLVYNDNGDLTDVWEEGYRGMPRELYTLKQLSALEITPREYKELRRTEGKTTYHGA